MAESLQDSSCGGRRLRDLCVDVPEAELPRDTMAKAT